jgi:predicted phosphodiesterase
MSWSLGVCAIISDVHGNKPALQAVLDDLSKERIDRLICLGDTIGYGAYPTECLDVLLQRPHEGVLGNHDHAAIYNAEDFHPAAAQSADWTRERLEHSKRQGDYFDYLGALQSKVLKEGILFVHGSPRHSLKEYVFPEDVFEEEKMASCFARIPSLCFQGHTHKPGVFVDGSSYTFIKPSELKDGIFTFEGGRKYMVNVGSVGQPRDLDPRACYVITDGKTCRYKRVQYNVEETIASFLAVRGFEPFRRMAERLRRGT